MIGVLTLKNEKSDEEKVIYHFKKEDVRSFFHFKEGIEIFLYGQGTIVLDYDEELYNKLKILTDE